MIQFTRSLQELVSVPAIKSALRTPGKKTDGNVCHEYRGPCQLSRDALFLLGTSDDMTLYLVISGIARVSSMNSRPSGYPRRLCKATGTVDSTMRCDKR